MRLFAPMVTLETGEVCGRNVILRWILVFLALFVVLLLFWKQLETQTLAQTHLESLIENGLKNIFSGTQLIATFSRVQENPTDELVILFGALDLGKFNLEVLGYECASYLEPYWNLWKSSHLA